MAYHNFKQFVGKRLILIGILLIAFVIRIYGINWDQGQHLHPDERFLTMVAMAEKIPVSLANYLDPAKSTLNPYNVGFSFFVYGTLPLTITKVMAVLTHLDNYADFTILGRLLSASADLGTLLVVYLLVKLWEKQCQLDSKLKYWAALFYGAAVFPIQQSHFFTTDSFLTFFVFTALLFAWRFFYLNKKRDLIFMALATAAALATKISIIYILPLLLFLIFIPPLKTSPIYKKFIAVGTVLIIFVGIIYLTLRFADPHSFETKSFLNPTPNTNYIANLKQLTSLNNPNSFYPPGIQWIGKSPVIFSLINIAFFGVGLPYFLISLWGVYLIWRTKKIEFKLLIIWMGLFFLYQSTQFVKSIRYFYLLYPILAIGAGWGMVGLAKFFPKNKILVTTGVLILILIWPISFMQIYSRPHSRVVASLWIYDNIPTNVILAEEYWDDPLPLLIPDRPVNNYEIEQMPVFDSDGTEKWIKINSTLKRADYIIFTSNRGYGSIMTVPQKYPRMSQFYTDLFSEKLAFKKIKEFTSYPTFPSCFMFQAICFKFDDQWSDEAFTVYDHPKVTIFQKQ